MKKLPATIPTAPELIETALLLDDVSRAGGASELTHRPYAICERTKQVEEALICNEMLLNSPRLVDLSRGATASPGRMGCSMWKGARADD